MISAKTIEPLMQQELAEANKTYPQFASSHEAYAIIKEELEELLDEVSMCFNELDVIWNTIKRDEKPIGMLRELKLHSLYAIQEAIQVGAMCDKAFDMYGTKNNIPL